MTPSSTFHASSPRRIFYTWPRRLGPLSRLQGLPRVHRSFTVTHCRRRGPLSVAAVDSTRGLCAGAASPGAPIPQCTEPDSWLDTPRTATADATADEFSRALQIVVDAVVDRLNDSLSQFAQKRSDDTTGIHDFEYNCHY
ncbi:hypothetical protein HYPSUDRAFT_205035 [Hypholoma sublateritium FD-334 SS-4]|uniref:Uncharacterized protein n=1 Tax=Hypholoma sublateritium (strain FD-334 SS-4) TaxID=945553 RepID=A0A0D2NPW2_HYPSF|nr:hypothetical protein HYPSUDRAFT_205035 [Hypholoma sublateritium FD-334 SS-4]